MRYVQRCGEDVRGGVEITGTVFVKPGCGPGGGVLHGISVAG